MDQQPDCDGKSSPFVLLREEKKKKTWFVSILTLLEIDVPFFIHKFYIIFFF